MAFCFGIQFSWFFRLAESKGGGLGQHVGRKKKPGPRPLLSNSAGTPSAVKLFFREENNKTIVKYPTVDAMTSLSTILPL
jgi:hypothetical protein